MDARNTQRIEAIVDLIAAAMLAAAVGNAAVRLGWSVAAGAAAAATSLLGGGRLLRSIGAAPPVFAIGPFELPPLPEPAGELLLTDVVELVLTDEDRLDARVQALEHVLANVERNSRVVRLFDPAAMPTPGELKDQIDRRLGGPPSAGADASQALHDALAELRRSLR